MTDATRRSRRLREQVAGGPADHRRGRRDRAVGEVRARPAATDLIIIYNSGRFRMAGRGCLAGLMPYGDANAIVMDMAREVLPVVERHAGARRRLRDRPVPDHGAVPRGAARPGSPGVQNFPTVGLIDGTFRPGLEETGMGYDLEVDMIAQAREMDLLTCPYVLTEDEAARWPRPGPTCSSRTSA